MNPKVIVIDGRTYTSVNEMPEDVRRQYEQAMRSLKDQNGNRIPDALESNNMLADNNRNGIPDIVENTAGEKIFTNAVRIVVDGREFNSLDDLPPDARARYEQAMGALDSNHNGIPDFVEGMMGMQQTSNTVSTGFGTETPRIPAREPMPVTPAIAPDTSNGWALVLLGAFLFAGCLAAAAGVWYFILR